MGLNCGIVGLPNVGKSTIFSAMTAAPAEAANYPFCTIDPNIGRVSVPDDRLDKIAELVPSEKVIPAYVDFVDIAGLVKGASKGEGLGNQFLSHIRQVGVIAHIVRCFEDEDVVHVSGKVDPASDIETIHIELALADLDTVEKRKVKAEKLTRSNDKNVAKQMKIMVPFLDRLAAHLAEGQPARTMQMEDDEKLLLSDLQLITAKKQIYVCNVDESAIHQDNEYVRAVKDIANAEGAETVIICGQLEAEIAALETKEEKEEFLEEAGLEVSGLTKLIQTGYETLGLRTFFTVGPTEDRAWTFHAGDTAPEAAGVIHSDFQKGFIKAEVYHCSDLFEYGSEQKVKTAGKLRIEGKEYVVQDGDVMHFKFNV
ncbi:MAG: redox-regulated ATPase YchF [Spirochaetia bacterium]